MIERFARTEFYIAGPIVRRSRQRFLFAAAPGNRSRKFQEEGVFTQPLRIPDGRLNLVGVFDEPLTPTYLTKELPAQTVLRPYWPIVRAGFMIYLVRHGQTEMNLQGRIQGQGDAPLTESGKSLAARIGRKLAAEIGSENALIFTSPLGRATQTAEIIAEFLPREAPVTEDARLAEVNLGEWDGLTIAEIDEGWPGARTSAPPGDWFFNAPNGESFESFKDRNAAFLEHLSSLDAAPKIIVTHGISGRVLRGTHGKMSREAMVNLSVPSDAFFVLHEGGDVEELTIG